jgi:hypothetical protein
MLNRYQTQVSSRRSLLNTIVALNPDTFAWSGTQKKEARTKPCKEALVWVNPVNEAAQNYSTEEPASPIWRCKQGDVLCSDWNDMYPTEPENFWKPSILEGIYMAARLSQVARLSGRKILLQM